MQVKDWPSLASQLSPMDYGDLFKRVEHEVLPTDCKFWRIKGFFGGECTLAHKAAIFGTLPEGFSLWRLQDNFEITVAMTVIIAGWELPESFNDWTQQVAGLGLPHLLVLLNKLPSHFTAWNLQDSFGDTVAHKARTMGTLPDDPELLKIENSRGYSVDDCLNYFPEKIDAESRKEYKHVLQTISFKRRSLILEKLRHGTLD
jgi:hypothetical protein